MPPLLPRKRLFPDTDEPNPRPNKRAVCDAFDADHRTGATLEQVKAFDFGDSESSLSDLASSAAEGEPDARVKDPGIEEDGEDEDADWEDAMVDSTPTRTTTATPSSAAPRDLELTLERHRDAFTDVFSGKKGPSKIEREIRIRTHCLHVQFLLFHNVVRNAWINDAELQKVLLDQLPEPIRKEVERWKLASGLKVSSPVPPSGTSRGKGKKRGKRDRDWGSESAQAEPGQPDLSRGDPTIQLLKVLSAYWKKKFTITAPGLRKKGYRPAYILEEELRSFSKGKESKYEHGERINNLDEFRGLARHSKGSRDVGAQLFTALLRALGLEARMVASLQPLGFGWTKLEDYRDATDARDDVDTNTEMSEEKLTRRRKSKKPNANFDSGLSVPIYWTEVISPTTQEIIPVDALVLPNAVATTPELLASFEPRGAKAEKAKQVVAYVVAFSPDATAKDVTTRYLKRHTWPGKTKGFRMPVEKVQLNGGRGPPRYYVYDWFKMTMRSYVRPDNMRTAVDDMEEARDLSPKQPDKKSPKQGDTLQSLRNSPEFVLERFLRREEAIRLGSVHVRTFVTGKGDKAKEEKVYRRSDVERCLSAESWHKEGRKPKMGERPLKLVPVRAVTLTRKREVQEAERETGEKQMQGLYALYQTEFIIPDPIKDGIIPKNAYGNIDCFVPSMIPKGATHLPWSGTVRICKKLGVDYAEAVTGFEFGSKMAVPVIAGVVVASENAELVKDAWLADDAERRKKEQLKRNKLILATWRKFIMGLRIAERIQEEYGDGGDAETQNPFTNTARPRSPVVQEEDYHEEGGGFLAPGEEYPEDGVREEQEQVDCGASNSGIDLESSELSDTGSSLSKPSFDECDVY